MRAIDEFKAKVDVHLETIGAAVTKTQTSVTGLQGDVTFMKAKIEELTNQDLPEEAKAVLGEIDMRLGTVAASLGTVAETLTALDELTPPATTG